LLGSNSSLSYRTTSVVKTEYSYFLIDPVEYDNSYLDAKDGDTIEFDGFRLDLIANLPSD